MDTNTDHYVIWPEKATEFWMVYVEGANTPAFKHTSFDAAEAEAKRLAANTSKETFVLSPVLAIRPEVTFHIQPIVYGLTDEHKYVPTEPHSLKFCATSSYYFDGIEKPEGK